MNKTDVMWSVAYVMVFVCLFFFAYSVFGAGRVVVGELESAHVTNSIGGRVVLCIDGVSYSIDGVKVFVFVGEGVSVSRYVTVEDLVGLVGEQVRLEYDAFWRYGGVNGRWGLLEVV